MIFTNPFLFYEKTKKAFIDFCAEDRESSPLKRLLGKSIKAFYFSLKGYYEDQYYLKASALTFVSLISLIPLLAFILSISKGLGAEKALDQKINDYIVKLPGGELTSSIINFKIILLEQVERLDFSDKDSKGELLKTIETLETFIISQSKEEEKESLLRPQMQDTNTRPEPDLFHDDITDQDSVKTSIKNYENELSKIVQSINFDERNAEKNLKEQIKITNPYIPLNSSLNAYRYKEQIVHFVEKTSFGYIGAIGLLALLYTVIRVLGIVEMSFNEIWKIKVPRSFWRKFSDYTSMLIILPILLLTSTTITAALTNEKLVAFLNKIWVGKAYLFVLGWFLPVAAIWIAFITAYTLIPNTRVKFIPAVIGGITGGTIFYILQIFYFKSQFGLARYNVIYGAFAAIPFFLLWLQISWIIVLFGAELSFVVQNIAGIRLEGRRISYATRELLGLIIMERITSQFLDGKGERWSTERLSETLNIPTGVVLDIIREFSESSLILGITTKQKTYYIPGRDPDSISVTEILHVMRNYGENFKPVQMTIHDQKMEKLIDEIQNAVKNCTQFTIKDIIQRFSDAKKLHHLPQTDVRIL